MRQTGYCPTCKMNVKTNRGKFSYLLAFILAFTGIGLIIYILYYLDRKANRCVHCNTACQVFESGRQVEQQLDQNEIGVKVKLNYCSYCGEQIKNEDAKFCFSCGSKI